MVETSAAGGLFPGPEGWWLAPEGALVHTTERVAVVADVHLGYEWARAASGDMVPAHSLRETIDSLTSLRSRVEFDRLIIAGDLVEPFGWCPRTEADLLALRTWIGVRGINLVALRGDHDKAREWPDSISIGEWMIAHGSRPVAAERLISGHLHTVIKVDRLTFPCFLIGSTRTFLPAFSANAAGLDVLSGELPPDLAPHTLRCIVPGGGGGSWHDFGGLDELRSRFQRRP